MKKVRRLVLVGAPFFLEAVFKKRLN